MNRNEILQQLHHTFQWDVVIIGGGATGLGAALDAVTRGYKILLVEQYDFAKGTSSRATKLVHGGVRYLAQGNIKLVFEALRERGRLLKNAPHITAVQPFILPVYGIWQKIYYGIGLIFYDLLSGKLSLGKTKLLSKSKTLQLLPSLQSKKLSGGILYYDGQFDDARLAIDIALTAVKHGAVVLNYCKATGFNKTNGQIDEVIIKDELGEKEYIIKCKAVINATGVFADAVMQMDDNSQHHIVAPSQGIHLVVDTIFFEGINALIIPKTADGRVLFAVPWHNEIIIGTTDTPVKNIVAEPKALEEEIEFVLTHFNKYCKTTISRNDVKSVFVGLRPLVKIKDNKNTSVLSRDHTILVSPSGLINITGGKWTTYRKMAEDVINKAAEIGELSKQQCITATTKIGEWSLPIDFNSHLHVYGNHQQQIELLMNENEAWKETIHADYPYTKAEVIWFVRNEMALTVEDVLARRTRLLFLNAVAAIEAAPLVADLMMQELNADEEWKQKQIDSFNQLAKNYTLI